MARRTRQHATEGVTHADRRARASEVDGSPGVTAAAAVTKKAETAAAGGDGRSTTRRRRSSSESGAGSSRAGGARGGGARTRPSARGRVAGGRTRGAAMPREPEQPGAIDLLRDQHREVLGLLERIMRGPRRTRERVFDQMLADLILHLDVEERSFYPALKRRQTESTLLESVEEHLSCKRILADLCDLAPDNRTFQPKLELLRKQVQDHIEKEESEIFPLAERMLREEQLAGIGQEMTHLMEELRGSAGGDLRRLVSSQTEQAAPI